MAEPANTGDPELYSVIPLKIVGKVVLIGAAGVKLTSLLTMATRVLFTYKLVTKCGLAPESLMVSGIAPAVPSLLEKAGPTTINAAPVYTLTC